MKKFLAGLVLITAALGATSSFAGTSSAMVLNCSAPGQCETINQPVNINPPPCWI